MKTIISSESPGLVYNFENNEDNGSQAFNAQSSKIGWLQAESDQPGAKYDIVIKDGLGRVRQVMKGCGNDSVTKYGALVNMPTMIGEKLNIELNNVRGAKKITLLVS